MKLFVVDAFSDKVFQGNQAGVVIVDENNEFLDEKVMINISAELKHSETAFVKKGKDENSFEIRYFTPNSEVDLCGHATVSAFTVLCNEGIIGTGEFYAKTLAGNLKVIVKENVVWIEMAEGKIVREFNYDEVLEIYKAYGLKDNDIDKEIKCCIVNTGLTDILLPVKSREVLNNAIQNKEEVIRLSKKYNAVGVHMFYLEKSKKATAYCRNFAPLYAIDEECATGTSNGALTYYLLKEGLIEEKDKNTFIQGEAMGKPSIILSRVGNEGRIYIGGNAVISITGKLNLT